RRQNENQGQETAAGLALGRVASPFTCNWVWSRTVELGHPNRLLIRLRMDRTVASYPPMVGEDPSLGLVRTWTVVARRRHLRGHAGAEPGDRAGHASLALRHRPRPGEVGARPGARGRPQRAAAIRHGRHL